MEDLRDDGGPELIEAWDLIAAFWLFFGQVTRDAQPVLDELGVGHKALIVLTLVPQIDSPLALAEALEIPPPTLSHILRSMEERGWLERSIDPHDRRRTRLKRTASGDRAWALAVAEVNRCGRRSMERLGPGTAERMHRILFTLHGGPPHRDFIPEGPGDQREE
jgi:DNA-binding MarR family transcriptional regulator